MISVTANTEGAAWTLRKLFRVAPELRAETIKELRTAAAPIVASAKAGVPATSGLKGWTAHDGKWSFSPGSIRGSIRTEYRQNKRDRNNQWTMLRVRMTNGIGVVYDMGGRKGTGAPTASGRAMLTKLVAARGGASRVMWPAAEANKEAVNAGVLRAIENATRRLNEELKVV